MKALPGGGRGRPRAKRRGAEKGPRGARPTAGPDLRVAIGGGLVLRNPIMTASGTFGYGDEFASHLDLARLGAVVVKSISLQPRPGNAPERLCETPAGMINSIGIMSVGVEAFIREKLPALRRHDVPVVASVFGTSVDEFVEVTRALAGEEGIAAIELNVGCPNIADKTIFGTDLALTRAVMEGTRPLTRLPLILKLTPAVSDVRPFARLGEATGADAIALINSIPAMAIDVRSRRCRVSTGIGGLSGPAIRPVAVRMVWEAATAVRIPVIGIGGIATAEDALEFLIAGASAVQVGTINFVRPRATVEILEGLERFCAESGIAKLSEVIGSVRGAPTPAG
jgi:dihydroorotate dehydrogenase (NAD+) catalytic subunit